MQSLPEKNIFKQTKDTNDDNDDDYEIPNYREYIKYMLI